MKSDVPSSIWEKLPDGISTPSISHDPFWKHYQHHAHTSNIHVAILSRHYLKLILDKKKTIESRFSLNRRTPYKKIKVGDVILFKESGSLIRGIGYASKVRFFDLKAHPIENIQRKYATELMIEDTQFWENYKKSSYASLIWLEHVIKIDPLRYSKRDQRAWVVF